jgi:hypothetical protein
MDFACMKIRSLNIRQKASELNVISSVYDLFIILDY